MNELSKTVARDMMVRIINQEFGPEGGLPNEAELCAHYGLSRVVIREAKKRLQALGMVQSRKKIGSCITPSTLWNFFNQELFDVYLEHGGRSQALMEQYFTLRLLLEPYLASQVAANHSAQFADDLAASTDRMSKALAAGDNRAWIESDLAFHIKIYEESHNILVLPLANLMRPLFVKGFAMASAAWQESMLQHSRLKEAILAHDVDQANHYARLLAWSGRQHYLQISIGSQSDDAPSANRA